MRLRTLPSSSLFVGSLAASLLSLRVAGADSATPASGNANGATVQAIAAGATGKSPSPAPAPAPAAAPPKGLIFPLSTAKSPASANDDDSLYGLTKVRKFSLTMSAEEWRVLQGSTARFGNRGSAREVDYPDATGRLIHIGGGFGGYFPWTHGDLQFEGAKYPNAGIRFKGNGSFNASVNISRKSMKVKFDLYGKAAPLQGFETLNFNSGATDPSRLRESLSYAVFRAAGVPAPRTAYAEVAVTVPGLLENEYIGLYTMVEQPNKKFTKDRLPSPDGLILKPEGLSGGITYYGDTWPSYDAYYRPDRVATPPEQRRLIDFAHLVMVANDAEFRRDIDKYLDVEEFLRFVAVNAMIVNTDSFFNGSHNFIMYLDPASNRFLFMPWDVDLSWGGFGGGGSLLYPNQRNNALIDRLLDTPAVLARYQAILRELSDTVFSRAQLLKMVDDLEAATKSSLTRESAAMAARGEFNSGRGPLTRYYVEQRIGEIQRQVAPPPPPAPAAAPTIPAPAAPAAPAP